MTVLPDIQAIARVMGGQVAGRKALVPGPGHSPRDRSLSVLLSPAAREGFFVHSFAGDPWQECRDYVCERLGIPRWRPAAERSSRTFRPSPVVRSVNGVAAEKQYTEFALRLWNEARDPR